MDEMKDKVQGKAREIKGSVTGDTGEQLKGKAQQAKGKVEGALNDADAKARAEADRADADVTTRRSNP